MEDEINELEEIDYKDPDDSGGRWEDRVTDTLNTLIRYVKTLEEKRK